MTSKHDWHEMGLNRETLFGPESMSYWVQFPPSEFIQNIVHELRELTLKMESWTKPIYEDSNVAPITLQVFDDRVTVQKACETILSSQERFKDILDLVWEYSKVLEASE